MLKRMFNTIVGPRVPETEPPARRWRYAIPTILLAVAAAILFTSYSQPYWRMTLHAPQYPKGLHVQAYLNRLEGDVREIDNLNHYIGMRPLEEAAQLERKSSLLLIVSMSMLVLAAIFVHTKWVVLLSLPAILFPPGFLLDLFFWLNHFGQNLDPTAALSSSVKPFTPPVLGEGMVGNFRTTASGDVGLWMAATASITVLIALFFHRLAFKPLVDRAKQSDDPLATTSSTSTSTRSVQRNGAFATGDSTRRAATIMIAMLASAAALLAGGPRSSALAAPQCADSIASGSQTSELTSPPMATRRSVASKPDGFDLHAAIAEAAEGAVVRVPAGVYAGPVVIDRPMTLIADGLVIIDGGGEGTVVEISGPDVTFRGFTVRSSGASLNLEHTGILVRRGANALIEDNIVEDVLFGISLKESPDSVVRGNTIGGKAIYIARRGDGIRLWASHDSLIENNFVHDVRDAVMWYSDRVQLRGNRIVRSRYGLHFMYSHDNVLEENVLEENSVGAFLMYSRNLIVRRNVLARNRGPSGYGLGLKDIQGVRIENNVIVANRVGVYIDNPPIYLPDWDRYTRNVFAYNDIGVAFQPSVRRVALYENSFLENQQQVAIFGGGELRENVFTMDGRGNFWSDYRGFDLAGDGIGDMPYQAERLWDSLVDREPNLRLFLFSPAQQAVELAARAFPVVRPRPLLKDDAPLMRAVRADVPAAPQRDIWPTWLVAAGLLGSAALMLAAARRP